MAEKAVRLRGAGEAPTWSKNLTPHLLDTEIEAARELPVGDQEKLFLKFAGHLYANRLQPEPDDHSDDDRWLADLGAWLGWTTEQIESAKAVAAKLAYTVGDWEVTDEAE